MASKFNDFIKENEFSEDYFVNNLIKICYQGAFLVKKYYQEDIEIKEKKDKSPVTIADEETEALIITNLTKYFPKISTIGEETIANSKKNLPFIETFFCIDPIDGTRQFINKNGFFTVNIGLIYKQKPIFGIVIDPMSNICWFGGPGYGAFKMDSQESKPYAISVDNTRSIHNPILLVSSLNWEEKHTKIFTTLGYPPKSIKAMGSSIKMVMIAEGKGDIYPRIAPTCEWDTAAAHAILLASGGDIYDLATQAPILYGKHDRRYYNNFFIACKSNNMEDIRPIINYSDVEIQNIYEQGFL